MMNSMEVKTLALLFGIVAAILNPTSGSARNYSYRDNSLLRDAKTDIYTIGGAGLAGAVLGLSTLSFAEKPSGQLKNIVTGGALGIIVGVVMVASSQADKSQNLLTDSPQPHPPRQFLLSHSVGEANPLKNAHGILFHFQF